MIASIDQSIHGKLDMETPTGFPAMKKQTTKVFQDIDSEEDHGAESNLPSEQQIKVDCLMGRRVSVKGTLNDDYGVAAHIKKVIPI